MKKKSFVFSLAFIAMLFFSLNAQVTKSVTVNTAGTLSTLLTSNELLTVTNLTLSGNIDARDFKTIRDNMPMLGILDLTTINIISYTGTEGTAGINSNTYQSASIPPNAFYGCVALISITLPNTLTSINDIAFYGCKGLTSIIIPTSVLNIGTNVFNLCIRLNITVVADNPNYSSIDGVLFDKAQRTLIFCPKNKSGGFTIPSSVTNISSLAFANCTALISVDIPNSVTDIGDQAFSGCTNLTYITIPESVITIGSRAFGSTNLKEMTIPNSVTNLGDYIFYYCRSLQSISIGNGVTIIGKNAFNNCSSLASVSIGNSVIGIGEYAFGSCTALSSITFPNSITSIGANSFSGCNINSISLPNSLRSIGSGAFTACVYLTSINIPSTITSIGDYAFYGCTGLRSIQSDVLNARDIIIGSDIFYRVNKTSCNLYIPKGSTVSYIGTLQWNDFINIFETTSTETKALLDQNIIFNLNRIENYFQVSGYNGVAAVTINTLNGKVISRSQILSNEKIDVSSIPRGIYILKINATNSQINKKILIE